jgi:hypothetical protein
MESARRKSRTGGKLAVLVVALVLVSSSASAHHGSSISYNIESVWTTWATVTGFNYRNPHPTMTFDRTLDGGEVEHWVAELLTNPALMARQGWTRRRTLDTLRPGARVKLYLATARAGGYSAIVMKIESENGEAIGGAARDIEAVDLDRAPGGLQPEGKVTLPGQDSR